MSRSVGQVYKRRVDTLKRRRDFLDKRIADYQGKDMSRDLAEASAIHWALAVIEGSYDYATECIGMELRDKERAMSGDSRDG